MIVLSKENFFKLKERWWRNFTKYVLCTSGFKLRGHQGTLNNNTFVKIHSQLKGF